MINECLWSQFNAKLYDQFFGVVNKTKLKVLGGILEDIENSRSSIKPAIYQTPVDELEFVEHLNRNKVFSETQIGELDEILAQIDMDALRSKRTMKAFESLLEHLRMLQGVYIELLGIKLPEQSQGLHTSVITTYHALLDLDLWSARSALAFTIEEAHSGQQQIQASLDRAATTARAASAELAKIDPMLVN